MQAIQPRYIETSRNSGLQKKIRLLNGMLSPCRLCPRKCGVDRLQGETGFCGAGSNARVSSVFAHFGEESCLTGKHGSGTVFFSCCNLKCVFCQNYELSHLAQGRDVSAAELAGFMMELKEMGCHNINLVTPTQFTPQIMEALEIAVEQGLDLPLVYNCGGYESQETIDALDGIIDIYMPDAKFSSPAVSRQLCNAPDYFENLKIILKKMHRQAGGLEITGGIAKRGLLVRHLVMPGGLAGTEQVMEFIAREVSADTYVNIMGQYRPCGEALSLAGINRPVNHGEYVQAKNVASSFGLRRLD